MQGIYLFCRLFFFLSMPLQRYCAVICSKERTADTTFSVQSDLVYKASISGGKKIEFTLDMYQPVINTNTLLPAIIFVHGGGFWEGDKRSALYVQMAAAYARHGYISFSVNYRLKDKDAPYKKSVLDTCIEDVKTAIRWIKKNSGRLHLDTTALFICGDSAGGGIIINTCYDPLYRVQFKGCIDLWGGLPGKLRWEAPVYNKCFDRRMPPTCIIHGTADQVVPYRTSRRLAAQLSAAGVYHKLYPLKAADHYPVDRAREFIPLILAFTNGLLKKSSN